MSKEKLIPNESGEPFWMFLSLLVQPVDKQISIIGGLPKEGSDKMRQLHANPALQLLGALSEYFSGWWDAFEPECKAAEEMIRLIEGGSRFRFSEEGFIEDENWNQLRSLAKKALLESGLDPWPVPDHINFEEYLEVVPPTQ